MLNFSIQFQTTLRFQKFFKLLFFSKSQFSHCFDPYISQVGKAKSAKNLFLVLFYSAKTISDFFTISKLFQVFFRKINFFHSFDPYTAKARNMKEEKKQFFIALSWCKIQFRTFYDFNFFKFFLLKLSFLTDSTPYAAQVRKVKSAKLEKNLNFSQYASHGKWVE